MFILAADRIVLLACCFQIVRVLGNEPEETKNNSTTTTTNNNAAIHIKEEQIAKLGKPYTLDCYVATEGEESIDIEWKNSKHVIEEGDKYSFHEGDTPAKRSLVINPVEFEDRDVYTCTSKFMNVTSTLKIRLRVRDQLGAIWPLIGIFVETFLLFLIIFLYEYRKTKYGETPPMVKVKKNSEDGEMTLLKNE